MEWLGLLLLYAISGYIKKRQQNAKRKEIESSPGWDTDIPLDSEKETPSFDQLFNDLFESNPKTPEPSGAIKDVLNQDISDKNLEQTVESKTVSMHDDDKNGLTEIDEQVEHFENNIYHSNLSDKTELHLGKKWNKKINLRKELFKSNKSLKKSMIIKEILDIPLALRK